MTYQDPCHLGRMGEPYVFWQGVEKKVRGQVITYDPPKEFRRGTFGIYEPPRNILNNIPGLRLVEMERIKEYAWCCGAGGGVKFTDSKFAIWTALERIKEAKATGAEAIVTACSWCNRNFKDAIRESNDRLEIYDIAELLKQAL